METSQVCIIGGGPTGVSAVKVCLEYEFTVICYDDRPELGGLWLGSEPSFLSQNKDGDEFVCIHEALTMNTSQFPSMYSDFPIPDDLIQQEGRFLSGRQLLEYLRRYAAKFNILERFKHSFKVVDVRKDGNPEYPDLPWVVRAENTNSGSIIESRHRYIVVASGFYRQPHIPKFPGMEESSIQILHSGYCRYTRKMFQGRRVLVVGGSISAGDMVETALRNGATKVVWALTRDPTKLSTVIWERKPFGKRFAWDEWPTLFGALYYPFWLFLAFARRNVTFVHRRSHNARFDPFTDRVTVHNSSYFLDSESSGRLSILHSTVAEFKSGETVILTDGQQVAADVCVIATGYKPSYNFLSSDTLGVEGLESVPLYRNVIATNPSLWGLCFLYTTPYAGGGIASTEMESRWLFHQLANGALDSEQNREKLSTGKDVFFPFKGGVRRASIDVIICIARELGCIPPLWPALLSPFPGSRRTALAAAFGPLTTLQFRLCGPHSKPEMVTYLLRMTRDVLSWKFDALAIFIDLLHVGAVSTVLLAIYQKYFK